MHIATCFDSKELSSGSCLQMPSVCFLTVRDKVSYPCEIAYTDVSIVIFNCATLFENQFASMILGRVLAEILCGLLLEQCARQHVCFCIVLGPDILRCASQRQSLLIWALAVCVFRLRPKVEFYHWHGFWT
jgi:hypothetical protein